MMNVSSWKKSSHSNSQGNCVEVMPIEYGMGPIPRGWLNTIIATNDSIQYKLSCDSDNRSVEFKIKLNSEEASILCDVILAGKDIGPIIELNLQEGIEKFKGDKFSLSLAEVFFLILHKYKEFYHENNDHDVEGIVASVLNDFTVRQLVAEWVNYPTVHIPDELPEDFNEM